MARRRESRGFTLIELMLVVMMIGIISSAAYPLVANSTYRSKAAERRYMMKTVQRAIEDCYRANGRFPAGPDPIVGKDNPLGKPGPSKRAFDPQQENWTPLAPYLQIEGSVYYSYAYTAAEGAIPLSQVQATGDLDGDGDVSTKVVTYVRDAGNYLEVGSIPPDGEEDATTF